jgi:hypothetical protein
MKNSLWLLVLAVLLLTTCRMAEKEDTPDLTGDEMEQIQTDASDQSVYYRFPSPEEILRYIHQEELTFQDELVNPVNNAAQYIDSKAQSINLGIYIADLAYATIFRKLSLASDYMEVVQRLSDALHIKYIHESEIKDRVQSNLSNLDSLMSISRESYNYMVDYLVETNNEKTLALISAGAYVEALYLVLNQIHEFNSEDEILIKVLEQKYAFGNLYKYMQRFETIPQIAEVNTELQQIQEIFDQIRFEKEGKTALQQEGGELVLTGSKKKLEADPGTVGLLRDRVNLLRNKFVQDL